MSNIGKIEQTLFLKMGGGCHDALLIYGAPKFDTVYLIKWQAFSLQRAPPNLSLPPSNSRPPWPT